MKSKKTKGQAINIACGETTTINELVNMLNELLNNQTKPIYTTPRVGEIRQTLANISEAKEILGYRPMYTIREGLKETVEYFKGETLYASELTV